MPGVAGRVVDWALESAGFRYAQHCSERTLARWTASRFTFLVGIAIWSIRPRRSVFQSRLPDSSTASRVASQCIHGPARTITRIGRLSRAEGRNRRPVMNTTPRNSRERFEHSATIKRFPKGKKLVSKTRDLPPSKSTKPALSASMRHSYVEDHGDQYGAPRQR
jgi:hypothetical protein